MYNSGDKVYFLGSAWEVEEGTVRKRLGCSCVADNMPSIYIIKSKTYGDVPIAKAQLFADEQTAQNESKEMLQLAVQQKEGEILGIGDAITMLSKPLKPLDITVAKAILNKSEALGWCG